MKKIITLVLAIALVLTSIVAFAEDVEAPAAPKGTPNINSFATLTVKYHEMKAEPWGGPAYWEITLSKPVDRLLINWTGKGEEPEELAVDENLTATALRGTHKYMPGTTQSYKAKPVAPAPKVAQDTLQKGWVEVEPSQYAYRIVNGYNGKRDGVVNIVETTTKEQKWVLKAWDLDNIDYIIHLYKEEYPAANYEIVLPKLVTKTVVGKDKFGNVKEYEQPVLDFHGNKVYTDGYIQGYTVTTEENPDAPIPTAPRISTVAATPVQTAFMTVQDGWAVYYNRAGRIVGIEVFEGQF